MRAGRRELDGAHDKLDLGGGLCHQSDSDAGRFTHSDGNGYAHRDSNRYSHGIALTYPDGYGQPYAYSNSDTRRRSQRRGQYQGC